MIWRLIKLILWLVVIGGIGLFCFSYAGPILMPDAFAPDTHTIEIPLELDVGS